MKLKLEDKVKITQMKEDGDSEASIAKIFNVDKSTIKRITRRLQKMEYNQKYNTLMINLED